MTRYAGTFGSLPVDDAFDRNSHRIPVRHRHMTCRKLLSPSFLPPRGSLSRLTNAISASQVPPDPVAVSMNCKSSCRGATAQTLSQAFAVAACTCRESTRAVAVTQVAPLVHERSGNWNSPHRRHDRLHLTSLDVSQSSTPFLRPT